MSVVGKEIDGIDKNGISHYYFEDFYLTTFFVLFRTYLRLWFYFTFVDGFGSISLRCVIIVPCSRTLTLSPSSPHIHSYL